MYFFAHSCGQFHGFRFMFPQSPLTPLCIHPMFPHSVAVTTLPLWPLSTADSTAPSGVRSKAPRTSSSRRRPREECPARCQKDTDPYPEEQTNIEGKELVGGTYDVQIEPLPLLNTLYNFEILLCSILCTCSPTQITIIALTYFLVRYHM